MTAAVCLRRWHQALPWCGLVWLSLAGAQLVQVVAASLLPPDPPPGVVSSSRQPDDKVARLAGSEAVIVILMIRNPTTGRATEYLCRTTRERVGTDALLIDAHAPRDVPPSLCDSLWLAAPVLPNGEVGRHLPQDGGD